ncbi:MAG: alanine--tRNA ligase [Clostridia bacterium]|nr:alanine--tRNA ligase [Clostridia bacterium]
MQKLGLNEIREKYLSFFESKGHLRLPSFPLIPKDDNSLLLINAGMAPLKPYFKGEQVPPRKRVTTCQKCIRTPDIERVGKTARHGTYFEMLGNFSFGDYFKHEATAWAWEFITKVLEIPEEKLWVTIYEDDDEAKDIWVNEVGVQADRIVRLGKEDNFWEIGTGPCGPCSEIHYDRGAEFGCGKPDCKIGCDCDRYMEFWNLVFTQFDKDEDGNYNRLAHPNIDTGMGLERIACIMQGVDNLFEVDTVRNIMKKISEVADVEYGDDEESDVSLRVITDHIRSTTFMIADGVQISNEGRGYVLRRLLRHAARHGKLLGVNDPFLYKIVDTVIEENRTAYPELESKADYIKKIIQTEEIRFSETINDGLSILESYVDELKAEGKTELSGDKAFKLYDTYGFPVDITIEILSEQGITVNRDEFDACMAKQRETARNSRGNTDELAWKEDDFKKKFNDIMTTEFVGYENREIKATVKAIVSGLDEFKHADAKSGEVMIMLDKTPFYGEGGGQIGDKGILKTETAVAEVIDTKKMGTDKFVHVCKITEGSISEGEEVTAIVCDTLRSQTEANHSATHLLQKALKLVLGDHVEQAGSFVSDERLRFDFSHYEAMTAEQLAQVEVMVNKVISEAVDVDCRVMPIEEANKLGAMSLFGEKYGSEVRVVKMGDFSLEFCGGTHVKNTSAIGLFKILSESSAAAGIRRIEAITGTGILKYLAEKEALIAEVGAALKCAPSEAVSKIEAMQNDNKTLAKEIEALKEKMAGSGIDDMKNSAVEINGVMVITGKFRDADVNTLRKVGDTMKDAFECEVCITASESDGKVSLVCSANKAAVAKGIHCGMIIKSIASHVGGSGGGRPDSAQAGGKDASGIDAALKAAAEVVSEQTK